MKLLAGGKKLDKTLARLIRKYDHIEFAVAWAGTGTETYDALCDNQTKIIRAVIGTHFYQTHPDVLELFTGSDKVRFVLDTKELFHPKAYFFWNSNAWELVIGSANMTIGGLAKNNELMLHLTSDAASDDIKKDFQEHLQGYWMKAKTVNGEDVKGYRRLWQAHGASLRRLAGSYGNSGGNRRNREVSKPPAQTRIMTMNWDEYLERVKNDTHHFFDGRCVILKKIRDTFDHSPRFSDMDTSHRKLVAGLPTDLDVNWGYFGSMKRAHKLSSAVANNNPHLSDALDQIPMIGPVHHDHYESYAQEFCVAFPDGGDGIAVLTRLLAMKRPDYFVCLDSRNMKSLCNDFGIRAIYNKQYDRYWDEVVCRIMDSVWWNTTEQENDPNRQVWRARAAMLDAIFYED